MAERADILKTVRVLRSELPLIGRLLVNRLESAWLVHYWALRRASSTAGSLSKLFRCARRLSDAARWPSRAKDDAMGESAAVGRA